MLVHDESMEIKIRPKEPVCTVTLSKSGWLAVLSFLTQTSDQTATDSIDTLLKERLSEIRSFVLIKGHDESSLILDREPCLDLYLHFLEFKDTIKDKEDVSVVETVTTTLKNFLVGEGK